MFSGWKQVTIFEELGVDLRIDVTREHDVPIDNAPITDVQSVDNDVPPIDDSY